MLTPQSLLHDLPVHLMDERFDDLVKTSALRLERILSHGHATPEGQWYNQDRDEWVMLVQGRARLLIEGQAEIVLQPGDHVLLPAHCRHRVVWTEPDVITVWLALHFVGDDAIAP